MGPDRVGSWQGYPAQTKPPGATPGSENPGVHRGSNGAKS